MTALRRLDAARALLAVSAVLGAILVALAVSRIPLAYAALIGALAAVGVLWWWRGVFSRERVALWLEERVPTLRFSLAALVDAPQTPFRSQLEARVRDARFANVLSLATLRLVGIPAALLVASQFVVAPLVSSMARDSRVSGLAPDSRGDATSGAAALRYSATIAPPAYAKQRTLTIDNPSSIAALVGSAIRFSGAFAMQATMPTRPTILRLESNGSMRMVALEPRADSTPRVVLELPARDTVIVQPSGGLRLAAVARDDIGLTSGWFEIIVSSGTGETFTFRTAVLGRASVNGARDMRLATILPLDSLRLEPGDVVHLRAVARDANPAAAIGTGSSETRTLRVPRAGELDSLAIEAAPPPEVDQSAMSQRMLIIVTERLVARMRSLSRETLATESASIAREQARLRKRVGEIIFTRLTGADHVDEDATAAMDDTLSPAEALLKAASEATNISTEEHAHEEGGPVIGVNRPLLEAFNAMWAAERRLGVSEPRQALPHMHAALDAIQRARAAERLYLRGRPPRIVLDIPRIRLTGKRDGIEPVDRTRRDSELAATLAMRARFAAALDLLTSDSALAAVDTLMVIRVDALGEQPELAAALGSAIDQLRAGRDATESLVATHRLLAGKPVTSSQTRWSGAW